MIKNVLIGLKVFTVLYFLVKKCNENDRVGTRTVMMHGVPGHYAVE